MTCRIERLNVSQRATRPHTAGVPWSDWQGMIEASIGPGTLSNYDSAWRRYLEWLDARPPPFQKHLQRRGPFFILFALLYLASLYARGLGHSSALMFEAAIGFQRTIHGLPRYDSSIITQINKAFAKRLRKAVIPLPVFACLDAIICGISKFNAILLFMFALGCALALRAEECWLLDRAYIFPSSSGFEICWPQHLMSNGVKRGPVRKIGTYAVDLVELFMRFSVNPLITCCPLKTVANRSIQRLLKCSWNACRHVGCWYALEDTGSMNEVTLIMGHVSQTSSRVYVDCWHPNISIQSLSSKIIQALRSKI